MTDKMVLLGGESVSIPIDNVYDTYYLDFTFDRKNGWKTICTGPKYAIGEPIPIECLGIEITIESKRQGKMFIRECRITAQNDDLGKVVFCHKGKIYKNNIMKDKELLELFCESQHIPFRFKLIE